MSGLFRVESREERERAWLGRIIMIRPISLTALSWAGFAFAIAIAAFFVFGEYTRKTRLGGVLTPSTGTARIVAQQAGRVEAVHVREGDQVRKEDVLLLVGDGRAGRES